MSTPFGMLVATYLGIEGAWQPPECPEEYDIIWPAIYAWEVPFIGRPHQDLVPDWESLLRAVESGAILRFCTYSEMGWLLGKTGGGLGSLWESVRVGFPKLDNISAPTPEYDLVMVVEPNRPVDFRLEQEICRQPSTYGGNNVLLVELTDQLGETPHIKMVRICPQASIVRPVAFEDIISHICSGKMYIELQSTWGPTLWALIAHAAGRKVIGRPWGGWQEWLK